MITINLLTTFCGFTDVSAGRGGEIHGVPPRGDLVTQVITERTATVISAADM